MSFAYKVMILCMSVDAIFPVTPVCLCAFLSCCQASRDSGLRNVFLSFWEYTLMMAHISVAPT
ncbi:hypothetical protein BDV39DRAFT_59762 [Aspergillus sergii]|uniref:Secreted protein n=1 Tax=Aspergillus sergii TaxID=1034303 RepID=A0A5N6X6U0_9EURO|nr:hypothetical protein BDV39DRAFT_59762 [Aspergillus sergii]